MMKIIGRINAEFCISDRQRRLTCSLLERKASHMKKVRSRRTASSMPEPDSGSCKNLQDASRTDATNDVSATPLTSRSSGRFGFGQVAKKTPLHGGQNAPLHRTPLSYKRSYKICIAPRTWRNVQEVPPYRISHVHRNQP